MQNLGQKGASLRSGSDNRQATLRAGVICDRGLNPKRPVNQDRYLAMSEVGLFAVFDGVGGRKAGEIASQTAADTVEEAFATASTGLSRDLIQRAILAANRDIYELGQTEPAYGSMATTVALLYLDGNKASIAHVGDSRVYRLSKGNLLRETIDHTDLDDKIRAGLIAPEDAALKEDDHSINRALGVDSDVDFELKTIDIQGDDRFLLCTDGVYRHLDDGELGRLLRDLDDPQKATDEIKRLVLERGADDNLTAVVVQIGGSPIGGRTTLEGASLQLQEHQRQQRGSKRSNASPGVSGTSGRIENSLSKGETKDRIHVHIGPDAVTRPAGNEEFEDDDEQAEATEGRRSNTLIYSLLVLVLVMGAFYAGLRSANLLTNKHAASRPGQSQLDQARQAYDRGDFREADQTLTALVAVDPQNSQGWYWLGRTQLQERLFAESARSLERTVELAPDMTDAYIQAAAAFEAMGNREKAFAMLGRYEESLRRLHEPGK
jgi:serine/threonine protein phosphatase PrpC/TolA-binding protein